MRLSPDEREVLAAEVAVAVAQLPEGEGRGGYAALLAEVQAGDVSEEHLSRLGTLVEHGLESGRIRALHGAHAEMAAARVFQRCPAGAAQREMLEAVNTALKSLAGAELQSVNFSARGPRSYTLTLVTSRCQATLVLDRGGIRLHGVEVG
jgi:hypothetical protein